VTWPSKILRGAPYVLNRTGQQRSCDLQTVLLYWDLRTGNVITLL